MKVQKIALIAVLTAATVVIGIVESFIPSIGIPGIKLGLANIMILVTLYELGIVEAVFVDFVRVILVSLIRGSFLSMGFVMSLTGAAMSLGVMILFYLIIKQFSIIGVSVVGAIFHVLGQILVAILYLGTTSVLYYLPFIGLSAIITGVIVGIVARLIIRTNVIKKLKEKYNFQYHKNDKPRYIMKKFIRQLLSGYLLIFLLLIIQVLLVIAYENFLDLILMALGIYDSLLAALIFVVIKLIEFVVATILFFKILNKDEEPEFKIAWLIGLLIMPVFTMFIYFIFGNHGLRKKDRRIVQASEKANRKYINGAGRDEEAYENGLGRALSVFNYIESTAKVPGHADNRITYYKTGEEFFPEMMKALREAKEFIFIEFFIITDGKLWSEVQEILIQKAEEGVEVRLIYDDMGSTGTISARTPKILGKYGIQCYKFHPFRPILSGAYNNRDHRKIVVVDHKYGFTGGMNLADEYGNIIERFGYWKDTMVKIEGSGINNLISTFLQNYDIASGMVSNFSIYLNHKYPKYKDEGYVIPFGDGPGGIDNALIGEQNYINILNYAQKEVYISTPYLVPTYPLLDALRNAALRGVKVHLILPGIPDKKFVYKVAKTHFRYLLDAGVNIYLYTPGFNHMKSALADDELAFVGTINFDFRSLVHHFECGALLYKAKCTPEIKEDFEQMISVSEKVPQDFKMRKGLICTILKLFYPLL